MTANSPPRIRFLSVDSLVPYEKNARVHDEAQIVQLENSIREWGWTVPVLADSAGIVAGHGRVIAARAMYERGEQLRLPGGEPIPLGSVPVIDCSGWSEAQRRAYILADNKLAANARWDERLLAFEVEDLIGVGQLTELMGFNGADLGRIFSGRDEGMPASDEWRGMPEFDQKDKTAFRSIQVHFKDEAAVALFERTLGKKLPEKARYLWYPEIEIERFADKVYVVDEEERA